MKILRPIFIALRFLTILPLPAKVSPSLMESGRSVAYFPLAGLVLGLMLAVIDLGLNKTFSPLLIAVVLVAFWTWLTGALHLEGFLDAADGLSAGGVKENMLKVMKDVHCGAKGVTALVIFVALKIALLAEVPSYIKWQVLIVVPVLARWGMACMAAVCKYARVEGLGGGFVKHSGKKEAVIATCFMILISVGFMEQKALFYIAAMFFSVLLGIAYVNKKFGGVTGDLLGASTELFEVIGLFLFCL